MVRHSSFLVAVAVSIASTLPISANAQSFIWPAIDASGNEAAQVYQYQDYAAYPASSTTEPFHSGVDILPSGTTRVRAVADGTVVYCATQGNGENTVILQHSGGLYTYYGHLAGLPAWQYGRQVTQGTVIANMGTTGNSTGIHLHFAVKTSPSEFGNTRDIPCGYGFRDPHLYILPPFTETTIAPTAIRVKLTGVNVRTGPGTAGAVSKNTYAVLTQCDSDQYFEAYAKWIGNGNEWFKIDLPNTNGPVSAWIAKNNAGQSFSEETSSYGYVQVGGTGPWNLRVGAGTGNALVTVPTSLVALKVHAGQRFAVLARQLVGSGYWYKINIPYCATGRQLGNSPYGWFDGSTSTYYPPESTTPTVTGVNPTSGPTSGGTPVTVTGSNLTNGSYTVYFGSSPATVTGASGSQITVTSPVHAAGTVDVTVSNAGGTSAISAADQFTYITPNQPPVVTGVSPTSGPTSGGTAVTVTGSNLTNGTYTVYFGSSPAAVTGASSSQITVTSPAHAAGTVDVTVANAGGTSAISAADQFTYITPNQPPVVTGISPTSGTTAGGTPVTVTGSNLTNGTYTVYFGSSPAAVTGASSSQITVTSPAHAAGTVDVTVANAGGTSAISAADQFTYITPNQPPVVTGISPTSGTTAGGTPVTVTGSNLTNGTYTVYFGSSPAVVTGASSSQITVTSPAHAAGTVDVTVANAGGTSAISAADQFTYVIPNQAPTVSVTTPGGTWSGAVWLSYTLYDNESDACSIQVQYSPNGGAAWYAATVAPFVSNVETSGLSSSPNGEYHSYVWDSVADLGYVANSNVKIRITPSDVGGLGDAIATDSFTVDNTDILPPPTLVSPGETSSPGNVLSQTPPVFTWTSVPGAASYRIYAWDTTANLQYQMGPVVGTTTYSPPPSFLPAGHSLRWAVATLNNDDVQGDLSLYRYFQTPTQYTLTTSVVNGHGSIDPPTGPQNANTSVTLTASPDNNYRVRTWTGTNSDSSTFNSNTVTMTSDKMVAVEFEPIPQQTGTVSVQVAPSSASWTIAGPSGFEGNGQPPYTGNYTFNSAPAGSYTWTGQPLTGYSTPPSDTKSLSSGGAISFSETWTPSGFEGDVAPRPSGDGLFKAPDSTQEGRFIVGQDTPAVGDEFQRADCAPRVTNGDGTLAASDWVQVRRFVVGLDMTNATGGPTEPAAKIDLNAELGVAWLKDTSGRQISVPGVTIPNGQEGSVSVVLDAQGDENAVAFSLHFDTTKLTYVSITKGADVPADGTLTVNDSQAAQGKLGLLLGLNTGSVFAAGQRELVQVTFSAVTTTTSTQTSITFANQPAAESISDANANDLTANYVDGTVTISDNTSAREVQVVNTAIQGNSSGTVSIDLTSQGNENAVAFSLQFDTTMLTYVSATKGADVPADGTLTVNDSLASQGKLGFLIGLNTGTTFTVGTREIVKVTFSAASVSTSTPTPLTFGNQPAAESVSDATANELPASFLDGTVTISVQPLLPIVTGVSPESGSTAGGTRVTVTGSHFGSHPNSGSMVVVFGDIAGYDIDGTDSEITVTSPSHAAGTVDIVIVTTGGTSEITAADQFTYTAQVTVPNVVGQTQASAGTTLTGVGVTTGTITQQCSNTVAAGLVISQSPSAGTQVTSGTAVALVVSTGCCQRAVPNVVGQTQSAASTALASAGLTTGTVTQQCSDTVASGHVISQNPAANAQAACGTAVALVVSTGCCPRAVPCLTEILVSTATTTLTNAGLTTGTVMQQCSDTVPEGHIISQSPPCGTMVACGTSVTLVVSSGCCSRAVPGVVGQTQSAAVTALTSAGLTTGSVTQQCSDTVASGHVISQNPTVGQQVACGTAVALVVSTGCCSRAVPDLVDQTQSAAGTALTGAGLITGQVTQQCSDTVASGHVISQNPAAGAQVNCAVAVALVVSTGCCSRAVPGVVGQTQAAANTVLISVGLATGSVTQQCSDTVVAGSVISQNPAAGQQVPCGTTVAMVISSGMCPVMPIVPDVTGLTQATASVLITGAGLTVGTVTLGYSDTVAVGLVISQSPSAGLSVSFGTAVALVISKGPHTVPNVVGLVEMAATMAIVGADLTIGEKTQECSNSVPEGSVIRQNPEAGTQVIHDSSVALVISTGPCVPPEAELHNRLTSGFDQMDSNGDGGVNYSEAGAILPGLTQAVFNAVDTDGDGQISRTEAGLGETNPFCRGCTGTKSTFTPDTIKTALGDLFLGGLGLMVLLACRNPRA